MLYNSLHSIPALNYWFFTLYYRIYRDTSGLKTGMFREYISELAQMQSAGCSVEDLWKRSQLQAARYKMEEVNKDYLFCAFACLLKGENLDLRDEKALDIVAIESPLSVVEMYKECDRMYEKFNNESLRFANQNEVIREVAIMRGKLLNATIENCLEKIEDLIKNNLKERKLTDIKNAVNDFNSTFTEQYISIGYTEAELRQVSAFEYLTKLKIETQKAKTA